MEDVQFAISWISFFDNELHTEIVRTNSHASAASIALGNLWNTEDVPDLKTVEAYKEEAFNSDGMINVLML